MKNTKGPLLVVVTLRNATENCQFGYWPPGEEFGPYDDLSSLYKDMKSEWGGKVTKMYRDTREKDGVHVGWVFTKTMQYERSSEDKPKTYVREAWVEVVREVEPAKNAKYESLSIGGG
jgi:hypothetical protein